MQTILTRTFGSELKAALKKAGLRQNVLARHLKMTPSAISQTVSGILVPSREHFDQICVLLTEKATDISALRRLWERIRLGEKEVSTFANRELLSARQRRRFSVVKLANLSGVPASRLRELESDPEALPNSVEREILSRILQHDFSSCIAERNDADERYVPVVTPILQAADRAAELPLLTGEILLHYQPCESLADFAAGHGWEKVRCGALTRGAVCAVNLDASMVGLAASGRVLIFLCEEFLGESSSLILASKENAFCFLSGTQATLVKDARWKLPVAEVVFQPEKIFR